VVLGSGVHSVKCELTPTRTRSAYAGSVMGREIVYERTPEQAKAETLRSQKLLDYWDLDRMRRVDYQLMQRSESLYLAAFRLSAAYQHARIYFHRFLVGQVECFAIHFDGRRIVSSK
jgi:hypothetical protein